MSNEPTEGSQTTLSKDKEESFRVGDHVTDREETEEKPMLVVSIPGFVAEEYRLGGDNTTVADVNKNYPAHDEVIEVVFVQRTDTELEGNKRYAYPESRLELRHPVHPDDAESGEASE